MKAITLVLISTLAACSWVAVNPYEPASPPPPDCTSSYAAPTFDAVLAVMEAASAGVVVGSESLESPAAIGYLVGSLVWVSLWSASAAYGFRHASECREVL